MCPISRLASARLVSGRLVSALLSFALLSFVLVGASPASAQVDDERPPVRAPLTLSASFSLRAPPPAAPYDADLDVGAAVLYTTSIASFVTSLGAAIAWVGVAASSYAWTVATWGYDVDPLAQQRDAAGIVALSTLGVGVATLVGAIVLDVSSDRPSTSRLSAACAPTEGGMTCSLGGAF